MRCIELESRNAELEYQCSTLEGALEDEGVAFRFEIADLEEQCNTWKQNIDEQESQYTAFECQLEEFDGFADMQEENQTMRSVSLHILSSQF